MDADLIRARLAANPATVPPEAMAALATSDDADGLASRPLVRAAVLVPIVQEPSPGVLLTKRATTLSSHAGQVAFPGGHIDAEDASAEAAALREAREEIGLPSDAVELLGRLPDYVTGTGFLITPVLGLVRGAPSLQTNPAEVEEVFSLPLAVLLDPEAPRRQWGERRGRMRQFWVWPHAQHFIWGATAAILVHLAHRLRAQEREAA